MSTKHESPVKIHIAAKWIAAPFKWCCILYIRGINAAGIVLRIGYVKAKKMLHRCRFAYNAISYRKLLVVREVLLFKDGNSYPVCPRCSVSMEREYVRYCDRCGQHLSWRRFDQAEICYPGRK